MSSYYSQQYNNQRGFTLVEMMTSIAIFTIITTMGLSALLSMVGASRQAQAQRAALDSLNFVVDAIARDARTGSQYVIGQFPLAYNLGSTNNGTGTAFSFHNQEGCPVTYRFHEDPSVGLGIIQQKKGGECGDDQYHNLTSSTVINIASLRFQVRGADTDSGDTQQPMVSFVIAAEATSSGATSDIILQTSVTQRLLDIPTFELMP